MTPSQPQEVLVNRAWIVMWLDATQNPPIVLGAGVYSESRPSVSDGRRCVPLWGFPGRDFADAQQSANDSFRIDAVYGWLGELAFDDEDGERRLVGRHTKALHPVPDLSDGHVDRVARRLFRAFDDASKGREPLHDFDVMAECEYEGRPVVDNWRALAREAIQRGAVVSEDPSTAEKKP